MIIQGQPYQKEDTVEDGRRMELQRTGAFPKQEKPPKAEIYETSVDLVEQKYQR